MLLQENLTWEEENATLETYGILQNLSNKIKKAVVGQGINTWGSEVNSHSMKAMNGTQRH